MEADERERLGLAVWQATVAYAAVAEPGVLRVPWGELDEKARECARVAGEAAAADDRARADAAEAKLAAVTAAMRRHAAAATLDLGFWVQPRDVRMGVLDIWTAIGGEVPPLTEEEIRQAAEARERQVNPGG